MGLDGGQRCAVCKREAEQRGLPFLAEARTLSASPSAAWNKVASRLQLSPS